jgi:hypothetical protein
MKLNSIGMEKNLYLKNGEIKECQFSAEIA